MRQPLVLHPHSQGPAGASVEVDVLRAPGGLLTLTYHLTGDLDALRLPAPVAAERADELWRTTCFEAFVRAQGGEAYYEFNFAPSTAWAAYRFSGYRSGMGMAEVSAPRIETRRGERSFALTAQLDLGAGGPQPEANWALGLSAVLEDVGGALSYWAAAHPSGKPDFHHTDGFAIALAAPEGS